LAQRRAAYDKTRQARFQPEDGSIVGPTVLSTGSRVRGGAAGRNLFLLLAAGTVGLGWWALQQPQLTLPERIAASANRPGTSQPTATVAPAVEDEAEVVERSEELPPLPDDSREPEVEVKVELPSLPKAEPARMPVRTAQVEAQPRRAPAVRVVAAPATTPRQAERLAKAATAKADDAPSSIDLAPLERHFSC
jgi:hypothetical protein